jgi:hypothetical protein
MIGYVICLFFCVWYLWVPLKKDYLTLIKRAAGNFLVLDLLGALIGLFFHPLEVRFGIYPGIMEDFRGVEGGWILSLILQMPWWMNVQNLFVRWFELKKIIKERKEKIERMNEWKNKDRE